MHLFLLVITPIISSSSAKGIQQTPQQFTLLGVLRRASETEANETSINFARKYAREHNRTANGILSFTHAFHGRRMGAISATPNLKYQAPFAPLMPGFVISEYNNARALDAMDWSQNCGVIVEHAEGGRGVPGKEGGFGKVAVESSFYELNVTEIRRRGLFVGMELHAGVNLSEFVESALWKGNMLFIIPGQNTVWMAQPIVITREVVERACCVFEEVMVDLAAKVKKE
ncbi:pyridoxal phosphate-dependent transferase [Chytriomyces sp. MP71]|nr:pyridoxal phosphate-dependent transferase [Chytriomyces sp. MP71]